MNAQELIIGHLLPIGAAIAVLWLVYRLLFINSNRLKFNRLFLLRRCFCLGFALARPVCGHGSPRLRVSAFGKSWAAFIY